jgi:SAM-dependent methyltransferase
MSPAKRSHLGPPVPREDRPAAEDERPLNTRVREYWEKEPCGSSEEIVQDRAPLTREWFEQIEEHRYRVEPCIHAVAQFTRHRGKRVLEVGVGAGTDHLQWARSGVQLHGVDLTEAAILTTRARLAMYGLGSDLQTTDAESLPFPREMFDVVYSWGVIHHSERPAAIISEIHRILRPGGEFIGMLYGRRSPAAFRLWLRYALLRGRPMRSFADVIWHHMESADVIWHHMESIGTKAYTVAELKELFSEFTRCEITPYLTPYDLRRYPRWLSRHFPPEWGWFLTVRAAK